MWETVDMLEYEDFPFKKEYRAAKRKYEELKETYEKKSSKKDCISRFHLEQYVGMSNRERYLTVFVGKYRII